MNQEEIARAIKVGQQNRQTIVDHEIDQFVYENLGRYSTHYDGKLLYIKQYLSRGTLEAGFLCRNGIEVGAALNDWREMRSHLESVLDDLSYQLGI